MEWGGECVSAAVADDDLWIREGNCRGRFQGRTRLGCGESTSDGQIVLAEGTIAKVTGEYIHYSEATALLYEQAEGYVSATVGNLALAPVYKKGWKTYNFEVEDYNTYIAGGVRVHNQSVITASGLHTYPGTEYQTSSGRVVVGSFLHEDGRVSGTNSVAVELAPLAERAVVCRFD